MESCARSNFCMFDSAKKIERRFFAFPNECRKLHRWGDDEGTADRRKMRGNFLTKPWRTLSTRYPIFSADRVRKKRRIDDALNLRQATSSRTISRKWTNAFHLRSFLTQATSWGFNWPFDRLSSSLISDRECIHVLDNNAPLCVSAEKKSQAKAHHPKNFQVMHETIAHTISTSNIWWKREALREAARRKEASTFFPMTHNSSERLRYRVRGKLPFFSHDFEMENEF